MRTKIHRFGLFVLGAIGSLAVVGCGGGGGRTPPPPPPPVPSLPTLHHSPTPPGPRTTPTPLPSPLAGLRAVAVQSSNTSAFVIVAGGFNGTANVSTVYTNTLAQDGTLGATWTISSNPLPSTLAHFGMVEANAQNSLVPANSHFIYAIGGQVNRSDTPRRTNTLYVASVDQTNGTVGTWKSLTSTH